MAKRPPAKRRRRLSKRALQKRKKQVYRNRILLFLFLAAAIALIVFIFRKLNDRAEGGKARKEAGETVSGEEAGEEQGSEEALVTMEFFKNGSIIETVTEDFDGELYSREDLKAMADSELAEYNKEAGEDKLELEEIKFKDGKALLSVKYASAEDYTTFNGEEIVFKKIAEVSSSRFTESVTGVKNNDTLAAGEIGSLKGTVIIMNADAEIETPKKIRYASSGVTVTGKKTAEVASGESSSFIIF